MAFFPKTLFQRKKRILFLFAILVIFSLINSALQSWQTLLKHKLIFSSGDLYRVLFKNATFRKQVVVKRSNRWILNGDIAQYSTIAQNRSGKRIVLEALVFFLAKPHSLLEYRRCLVKIKQNDFRLIIPSEILLLEESNGDSLYKIKCVLASSLFVGNNISVAVVDIREILDSPIIFLQKPNGIIKQRVKKQAIINCVHTLRNVDQTRYLNIKSWLEINKAIGVSKVRMCFVDSDSNIFIKNLQIEYSNYVKIVYHGLNSTNICVDMMNGLGVSRQKFEACVSKLNRLLTWLPLQEKLCANDCFQQSRHIYMYLTNYDIDEFIFPRLFNKNYQQDLLEQPRDNLNMYEKFNNDVQKAYRRHNMLDYINYLNSIFGERVAQFHFENYLILNEYEHLYDKIFLNVLNRENGMLVLDYENHQRQTNLRFRIDENNRADMSYFESFKVLSQLVSTHKTKYINQTSEWLSKIGSKWQNPLASLLDNRNGKSIFNTDYTISINPHKATRIRADSFRISVPIKYGFASHFRDEDISSRDEYGPKVYTYPIRTLVLDIEYFYFLMSYSTQSSRATLHSKINQI